MRRIVIALATAGAALAVASSAAAAPAAAPKISFKEVTPGWYTVSAAPAAPVKVTLRYGLSCNWIRATCRTWKLVGTKVLPQGASGDAARISWLFASAWSAKASAQEQLPQGFYRMALVVPGQPASLVETQWRLASGDD